MLHESDQRLIQTKKKKFEKESNQKENIERATLSMLKAAFVNYIQKQQNVILDNMNNKQMQTFCSERSIYFF